MPRELRHSFVSLLPDAGVPIEQISRLVRTSSRLRNPDSGEICRRINLTGL
jgi:hypothetical protein